MDAEIVPEPSGDQREALLAALPKLRDPVDPPPAYRSPWRLAGLAGDDEAEA